MQFQIKYKKTKRIQKIKIKLNFLEDMFIYFGLL